MYYFMIATTTWKLLSVYNNISYEISIWNHGFWTLVPVWCCDNDLSKITIPLLLCLADFESVTVYRTCYFALIWMEKLLSVEYYLHFDNWYKWI